MLRMGITSVWLWFSFGERVMMAGGLEGGLMKASENYRLPVCNM
jgi:hypothetical protein